MADEEKKPDLPGDLDELNGFRLGPSVKFWRNWQNDGGAARRIVEIAQQTASSLLSSASSSSGGSVAANDLLSTQYWAYHILRRWVLGPPCRNYDANRRCVSLSSCAFFPASVLSACLPAVGSSRVRACWAAC